MTELTFSADGQVDTTMGNAHVFFGEAVANGVYRTPGYFEADPHSEPRPMFSVPESQLYFWSAAWQAGERESLDDIARGDVMEFDDPAEATQWLLS